MHEPFCPICNRAVKKFVAGGTVRRKNARCPRCRSFERHRMAWLYLQRQSNLFGLRGIKMLHIAAEPCFENRFRRRIGAGYVTADLNKHSDIRLDVRSIPYSDELFDVVFCSHVLEHVDDDVQAIREFARILKPDGWALFLVPITTGQTFEDPTITDPWERHIAFGQHDHVRQYGPDFVDRLQTGGFSVHVISANNYISPVELERFGIDIRAAGDIFHCTKDS